MRAFDTSRGKTVTGKPGYFLTRTPMIAAAVLGVWAFSATAQTTTATDTDTDTGAAQVDVAPDSITPAVLKQADILLWKQPGPTARLQARGVLEIAAADGNPEAQLILGRHLLHGWILERNVARGIALLEQAVAAGHAGAQVELGQAVLSGNGMDADPERAQALLEQAVSQGNRDAMRVLGKQLVGGWELTRDVERGRVLLDKAIAEGDEKARVALGELMLYGVGLEQDRARALELFEAAAENGNGEGLAIYGEDLMWSLRDWSRAEAMLTRAAELGATEAWVTLAHGAMYGYLGGGRRSRAKFDGFAEKAHAAGEEGIAVLEATRNMWGINMRASGPETIARLRKDADAGNAAAARFLIGLLRDGNGLNLRRRPEDAAEALETYRDLFDEKTVAQLEITLAAAKAWVPKAWAEVAEAYAARPDLKSIWFGKELYKANENVAFYILQQRFREEGLYRGPINGYATRSTLRATNIACRTLDKTAACYDSVMRPDVIGALLAQ